MAYEENAKKLYFDAKQALKNNIKSLSSGVRVENESKVDRELMGDSRRYGAHHWLHLLPWKKTKQRSKAFRSKQYTSPNSETIGNHLLMQKFPNSLLQTPSPWSGTKTQILFATSSILFIGVTTMISTGEFQKKWKVETEYWLSPRTQAYWNNRRIGFSMYLLNSIEKVVPDIGDW